MPTSLFSVGYPQVILIGIIYALPNRRCMMFSESATTTFEQSNSVSFANPVALTLTDGQAEVAGGFIRCAVGNTLVNFKAL